jgi:uncharacterized membrane protein YcaP (DUF421 family)
MGKRQIGEMQPFEFIVTLIIADLACVPMADVSIPLVYGIVAILVLFVLHQLLTFLEQKGDIAKLILSGKPSIVIDKSGVNMRELKKNNMGLDDLIESMRALGYFSLDDLSYAIFESNGKLSALPNPDKENTESGLPITVIDDGKAVEKNLKEISFDKDKLNHLLLPYVKNIKDVEVLTIDGNGRAYFKAKNRKYQILRFELKEEIKW